MKNSRLFYFACTLWAVVLLCFVSTPLITLAFVAASDSTGETSAVNLQKSDKTLDSQQPAIAYLNDTNLQQQSIDNRPVYDVYTVAERQSKGLSTELIKSEPYYADKIVYLTFDDGPDSENTPTVLAILKEYGIKATFFVVGTQVEKHPEIIRQIFEEGHAIGNHTYNHIYRELYRSDTTYREQLHRTDELIKNIIGVRPRISRAPGGSTGSFNKEYWESLRKEGYIEVGWNISSGDASSAKAEQLIQNIAHQIQNKFLWSHSVVLMHDGRGHSETVKALPGIIKLFKDQGFEFRVVNFGTPPPW